MNVSSFWKLSLDTVVFENCRWTQSQASDNEFFNCSLNIFEKKTSDWCWQCPRMFQMYSMPLPQRFQQYPNAVPPGWIVEEDLRPWPQSSTISTCERKRWLSLVGQILQMTKTTVTTWNSANIRLQKPLRATLMFDVVHISRPWIMIRVCTNNNQTEWVPLVVGPMKTPNGTRHKLDSCCGHAVI